MTSCAVGKGDAHRGPIHQEVGHHYLGIAGDSEKWGVENKESYSRDQENSSAVLLDTRSLGLEG